MKERISDALFVVVALCAIVTAVLYARDRITTPRGRPVATSRDSVQVRNWREYAGTGHRIGLANAPVTIIEFGDLQCPACRKFYLSALRPVVAKYGDQVAVVFREWPLPYHKSALPAARAADCAADQGHFAEFVDRVYEQQESLGVRPLWSFAKDAGVPDSTKFAECSNAVGPIPGLAEDTMDVRKLGGHGTPTLLINSWEMGSVPDSARLDQWIQAALKHPDRLAGR